MKERDSEAQALSGTPLATGARVTTGKGARALVRTAGGAAVFLRGETVVVLEPMGLSIEKGEAWLDAPRVEGEAIACRLGKHVVSASDAGLSITRRGDDATVYVAATPLKATPVTPTKPVPLMVTRAPTAPLVGLKATIVGGSADVPTTTKARLGTAAVGLTPVIVGRSGRLGDWTMVNFLQRHAALRPPRTPTSACHKRSRSDALAGQCNCFRTRPEAHGKGAEDPGSPRNRHWRACCARTAIWIVPPDAGTGSGTTRTTTGPGARVAAASLGGADHSPSPMTSAAPIIATASGAKNWRRGRPACAVRSSR